MDTTLDTKRIDAKTSTLLKTVFGDIDTIKLPIDLNKIAKHYRLKIKQGTFADERIEGAFDRSSSTIFLSKEDSFEEKNFTLAHELGHYRLHEELDRDVFTMYQMNDLLERQGKDQREDQADQFAASLLMPKELVEELWPASGNDLDKMVEIFGVPRAVVEFRLELLKLR